MSRFFLRSRILCLYFPEKPGRRREYWVNFVLNLPEARLHRIRRNGGYRIYLQEVCFAKSMAQQGYFSGWDFVSLPGHRVTENG
jgi:hypothetical protein